MTGTLHICVAMKPLDGNFAQNALKHGVAGLNIDGGRIGTDGGLTKPSISHGDFRDRWEGNRSAGKSEWKETGGRFPANIIHDGSDDVLTGFPMTGASRAGNRGLDTGIQGGNFVSGKRKPRIDKVSGHNDNGGSAARFFKQVDEFKGDET